MKFRHVLTLLVVAALGAGVWWYGHLMKDTPIGDLVKNPRKYEGKVLNISGKVGERISLLWIKTFRLEDQSGTIWVVTRRAMPQPGEKTRVKGRVRQAFSIMDQQLTVFVEEGEDK